MVRIFLIFLLFFVSNISQAYDYYKDFGPDIIYYEGAEYHNNPKDPGGPTKFGWTLKTFRELFDSKATEDDIKNLEFDDAIELYRIYFWEAYGANKINNKELAESLCLAQINLGPYRPNVILQEISNDFCDSNLKVDGHLGKDSIKAINKCEYVWPGFAYVLFYKYKNSQSIKPVWSWARSGLRKRIFHNVKY